MSRIIGEHFLRNGRPKVKYGSRAEAIIAIGHNAKVAYRCKFCGSWHHATDHAEIARRKVVAQRKKQTAAPERKLRRREKKANP